MPRVRDRFERVISALCAGSPLPLAFVSESMSVVGRDPSDVKSVDGLRTETEFKGEKGTRMTEQASNGAQVTGEKIKAVRKETRAGTLDCRKALEETNGDVAQAVEYLRERGIGTPKKVWT